MKKEYLFLVVAIVVLGGLLFNQKRDRTHYQLPELPELKAGGDRLELSRGKDAVEIKKVDGKWLLLPQKWQANQARVVQMVNELKKLKPVALISDKKNYRLYELTPEKGLRAAFYQGDKLLREVVIGKCSSNFRQTYIRLKGDDRVYQALGNLKNNFFVSVADLRDKTVMKIPTAELDKIDQITLEQEKSGKLETLTMVRIPESKTAPAAAKKSSEEDKKKQEKAAAVVGWQLQDGRPVAAAAVKSLLKTLADLPCQKYLDKVDHQAFAKPWYRIRLKAGDREYSLTLLAEKDGGNPALSSYVAEPFKLPSWRVKSIAKDFSAYTGEKPKSAQAQSKKLKLPGIASESPKKPTKQ